MQREIKFRAWDKENKEFVPTDILINANGEITRVDTGREWTDVDHLDIFELMQYTGLKDKNGKEIYEKDLVKDGNGKIAVIEWHDLRASWIFCDEEFNELLFEKTLLLLEVVGNIYEHPELLETRKTA